MSVGLTFPGDGRSNRPYLSAELISTAIWPVHPTPANFAASRSVHSFPALFSRTACGIRRDLRMGCLGSQRQRQDPDRVLLPGGLRPHSRGDEGEVTLARKSNRTPAV